VTESAIGGAFIRARTKTMSTRKVLAAKLALGLLTVAALFDLYFASFDVWMTAYPFVDASVWRLRLYLKLAIVFVIAVLWFALAVWLFGQRRQSSNAMRAR
jgi:hypothetical protein